MSTNAGCVQQSGMQRIRTHWSVSKARKEKYVFAPYPKYVYLPENRIYTLDVCCSCRCSGCSCGTQKHLYYSITTQILSQEKVFGCAHLTHTHTHAFIDVSIYSGVFERVYYLAFGMYGRTDTHRPTDDKFSASNRESVVS